MKKLIFTLFALTLALGASFAQTEIPQDSTVTGIENDTTVTSVDPEFLQSIKVYPNPFRSDVTIQAPQNATFRVLDISGRPVDIQSAAPGLYLIVFQDRRNMHTVKVQKI